MLKLRITLKNEDKFGLLLTCLKNKGLTLRIENLYIEDEDYIYFLLEYNHPKYINSILSQMKDISEVIGFPIEFAFVYGRAEAYTHTDTQSHFTINWFSLNTYGRCL